MGIKNKLKIIFKLNEVMKDKEWPEIDLVLDQFGFRTEDQWSGSKEYYVQEMIKDEEISKLYELASFYDIDTGIKPVEGLSDGNESLVSSWKPDSFCVFLSHLAVDKKRTAIIQKQLERYNISSFVAHNDIVPGLAWQDEIEKALMCCDALVALLIPNFHESDWTDQEIGYVMGRGKKILTVRLGLDPYGFIGKFQGIQGLNKSEYQIAREIFEVFAKNPKTKQKMSEAIINRYMNITSYADAREVVGYVETLEYLDDNMIKVLKEEMDRNSQIHMSNGVPERIRYIIRKYK